MQAIGGAGWAVKVSERTNVLLMHGPPAGHLDDGGKGCEKLLVEIWSERPMVVICGHIHAD
jgi:Icc-related predicted phosphoesterase